MTSSSITSVKAQEKERIQPIEKEAVVDKCVKAFRAASFSRREKKELKTAFRKMEPGELMTFLDSFFEKICQLEEEAQASGLKEEMADLLDELETAFDLPELSFDKLDAKKCTHFMAKFAELIPFEKLQSAVQIRYENVQDALQAAKGMVLEAKEFLDKTGAPPSPGIHAKLLKVLSALLAFMDSIIGAFGVADFFKPADGDFQADFKLQKIFVLLSLFTFLTATLLPMYGITTSSSIVGGCLLLIAVLSLVWPKIRPVLPSIPEGKNWSKDFREGKLTALGGREVQLDEVANILKKNLEVTAVKEHVLVTGPSGIGKTELGKNLVQAIERGDYPEFAGMDVIYFNTADIVNDKEMFSGKNKILKKISEAIQSRRNNVIIILDEIHLACQVREDSTIGDQLKTVLDNDFPNVIGFTTEEEFVRDIYENQSAFFRRFAPINIGSTTPDETREILLNFYLRNAQPGVVLDEEALDLMIKNTQDLPQPLAALKILSRCLRKMTKTQKTPSDNKLIDTKRKVRTTATVGASASFSMSNEKRTQDISEFREAFNELVLEWQKEKKVAAHLFDLREIYSEIRRKAFQQAIKVSDYTKRSLKDDKDEQHELKMFLLYRFGLGPALESAMRSQAKKMGIKILIDKELVEEVFKEKEESDKRVAESIRRARETMNSRKDGNEKKE